MTKVTTESVECLSCGCDYLAFSNSKEYKHKVCYRCLLKGLAKEKVCYECSGQGGIITDISNEIVEDCPICKGTGVTVDY